MILDGRGGGTLLITSRESVLEPYLDFLIEVRWPEGRLLREYTILLDLPILSGPASGMTTARHAPDPPRSTKREAEKPKPETKPSATITSERNYGADASASPQAGANTLSGRRKPYGALPTGCDRGDSPFSKPCWKFNASIPRRLLVIISIN